MKNENRNDLVKRVRGDMIINSFVAALFGAKAFGSLASFISCLVRGGFETGVLQKYAMDFTMSGLICATLVLLSVVLFDIKKNGKPFAARNVTRLRVMALLLALAIVAPAIAESLAAFLDPNATEMLFRQQFGYKEVIIFAAAVIVGIISEIFSYGSKVEEELDSIA